ncbi:hypothetical protein BREVNS_2431 [Brevinematales bacterium NS]|jgi:hypothetical protein|nr:hypothetical protein BREVNS_2431 [Brevinematales bacterium NS]
MNLSLFSLYMVKPKEKKVNMREILVSQLKKDTKIPFGYHLVSAKHPPLDEIRS